MSHCGVVMKPGKSFAVHVGQLAAFINMNANLT